MNEADRNCGQIAIFNLYSSLIQGAGIAVAFKSAKTVADLPR